MEGRNPCLGKALFATLRHWIGERTLKTHQLGPVNSSIASADTMTVHSSNPISEFGCSYKDFFRIASAQRAGSAKWSGIDDGHAPTSRAAMRCDSRGSRTGSDYDDIEVALHVDSPAKQTGISFAAFAIVTR